MTHSEILAAIALAEAATKGEWSVSSTHKSGFTIASIANGKYFITTHPYWAQEEFEEADAKLIAASRTLVPALARELLRVRRKMAEMTMLYQEFSPHRNSPSQSDVSIASAILAEENP